MTSVISYANEVIHADPGSLIQISVFLRACNFYCMAKMVFIFHVSYEVCGVKFISGVVSLLSFYPVEPLRIKHGPGKNVVIKRNYANRCTFTTKS